MKKIIMLLSIVALFSFVAKAQESNTFKAAKGNFSLEVGFNPVGFVDNTYYPYNSYISFYQDNSPIASLGLKCRYFVTDRWAIRLNIPLSGDVNNTITYGGLNESIKQSARTTNISYQILPGFEYHIGNLKKLSPYFGFEIGFVHTLYSSKFKNVGFIEGNTIESNNAYVHYYGYDPANPVNEDFYCYSSGSSSLGFTTTILAGVDWYITQHLYLGVEFGFGHTTSISGPYEIDIDLQGIDLDEIESKDKTIEHTFGFKTLSLIRLGWLF